MNILLSDRLQTIEQQCLANAQYSRWHRDLWHPSSVSYKDLEGWYWSVWQTHFNTMCVCIYIYIYIYYIYRYILYIYMYIYDVYANIVIHIYAWRPLISCYRVNVWYRKKTFSINVPSLYFVKHHNTSGFLMFSGAVEVEHWLKMG